MARAKRVDNKGRVLRVGDYRGVEYYSADRDRARAFRFAGRLGYDDVSYLYGLYYKSDSTIQQA